MTSQLVHKLKPFKDMVEETKKIYTENLPATLELFVNKSANFIVDDIITKEYIAKLVTFKSAMKMYTVINLRGVFNRVYDDCKKSNDINDMVEYIKFTDVYVSLIIHELKEAGYTVFKVDTKFSIIISLHQDFTDAVAHLMNLVKKLHDENSEFVKNETIRVANVEKWKYFINRHLPFSFYKDEILFKQYIPKITNEQHDNILRLYYNIGLESYHCKIIDHINELVSCGFSEAK